MTTKELYDKFQKSGINGDPIITDTELKELHERLEDIKDFLKSEGGSLLVVTLYMHMSSIESILEARKRP